MAALGTGRRRRHGDWPWREAELRRVLDGIPLGIAVWNDELLCRFANRDYAALVGAEPVELVGAPVHTVLTDRALDVSRPHLAAVAGGAGQAFERAAGDAPDRVVEVRYERLPGDGGLLELVTDLSPRTAAEQLLRAGVAHMAQLRERKRVAAQLEEQVARRLFEVGMLLASIGRDQPSLRHTLQRVGEGIDAALGDLRSAVFRLEAGSTGEQFAAAARTVLSGAAVTLGFAPTLGAGTDLHAVPPALAADVLAILTEALTNVAKHAAASRVEVTVTGDGEHLEVTVADDGRGLPAGGRRSGLANARARAERLGGSCSWSSNVPRGTVLRWRVPHGRAGAVCGAGPAARPSGRPAASRPMLPEDLLDLLAALPVAVGVWDRALQNRYANTPAAAATLHPTVRPYLERALGGAPATFERAFRDGAAAQRRSVVSLTPLWDGDAVRAVCAVETDVTDRYRGDATSDSGHEDEAVLHDRRRIAEDLHDFVIQGLYGLTIRLQLAQVRLAPADAQRLEEVLDAFDASIAALRTAIAELTGARQLRPS